MSEAMIRLESVSKVFPASPTPAVRDLSLDVAEGEVLVLVGPSGCGKTTTLKMINRLVEASSGSISVGGVDIHSLPPDRLRRGIGYVIQRVGLFPHRTVRQNIATVPALLGWDRERIDGRVDELIDLVGLERGMGSRYPGELSGGQQQRVGVARALAADPPVLLMDEPFGAVDPIVRARLQDELVALQRRLHKTIVFVTHDIDEAIKLGDRVAILNVGGILEQHATPAEVLARPASPFVEQFLGSDRGLKRLSLIPIGEVELERGPVVEATAGAADVYRVMKRFGVDWVGVADGTHLAGWIWGNEVAAAGTAGIPTPRDFAVRLQRTDSLREALDAVVRSDTRVAVVFDGDHYLGMLTVEAIGGHLVS